MDSTQADTDAVGGNGLTSRPDRRVGIRVVAELTNRILLVVVTADPQVLQSDINVLAELDLDLINAGKRYDFQRQTVVGVGQVVHQIPHRDMQ